MTKHPVRVIGSTDVYSRKAIDRVTDRLDKLHYLNLKKIGDLKARITELERIVREILELRRIK